eukprot:gnl/TRDRNA2_/TRDRNA2_151886_c0_seq1.p1 gnl/TRDRNA2_/TRDRNA2_151886_c0~~gnl/TRDRNA2_/TRDRNA2_151886_c0_seq1.p1  ORF type:complete len:197 (+),score=27.72 gnl/TRDRNA2_/TRDRNA2_151886_c0_seq1:78-668(+)
MRQASMTSLTLLLSALAHVHAKEDLDYGDLGMLANRAFTESPRQHLDLDTTALGKSSHLMVPRSATQAHARPMFAGCCRVVQRPQPSMSHVQLPSFTMPHGRRPLFVLSATKVDDYAVLGLPKGATKDQIKAAYRKKALRMHPDVDQTPGSEERFLRLKEASHRLLEGGGDQAAEDDDEVMPVNPQYADFFSVCRE